ncbi:MAG TPA: hypothetical protein VKQ32_06525 [Polyangia bacterium]|nr:hypothetical protein [Polyangia bacterium]
MLARGGHLAFALGAAVAVAAGCDWRDFDKLEKTTPVQAIKAPSNYPAGDDFGPILLPLAPPADKSAAGRFIATATNRTSVAVMYVDAAGGVRGDGVNNDALIMLGQWPVVSIAAIPGGTDVLLGSPYGSSGAVLDMNVNPPYTTKTFQNVLEPAFGVGVGAGNIGGAAAPEVVVLSANTLHVYTDGIPTDEHTYASLGAADPCPFEFSTAYLPARDQVSRAVLVAPLLATGTQIAVGTPEPGTPGHVAIFDFDATTGAITCAAALTATDPHFGRSMALVDIDGDGAKDHLLVGAPPAHAYLYTLPLTSGQAPAMSVTDPMGGGDFGAAVAAFDIDGKPGDEMFVGDPDATVNGTTTAGKVTIYTGPTMTMVPATTVPNPLAMHEPKTGNGYGSGLAGMTFCPGAAGADAGAATCAELPLVGSLSRVYAYFTLKKPDPRVK